MCERQTLTSGFLKRSVDLWESHTMQHKVLMKLNHSQTIGMVSEGSFYFFEMS